MICAAQISADMMNPTPDTSKLREDATVIGLVGFVHGTSHFFQLLIPPLFPWLMQEFALNYTEVAAMMTVFFVISGTGQSLAGFLVDRYGPWRVLCCGIGTLVLSAVLLSAASSYAMLMMAATLAGVGNCVFHSADYTLLNRGVSPQRLGHAFSVHGLSGSLGWAAGPILMVSMANFAGWRAAAQLAAILGVLALLLLISQKGRFDERTSLQREIKAVDSRTTAAHQDSTPFAFLNSRLVWLSFSFYFFAAVAFGVLQNFSPVMLHEVYGLSLNISSTCLTAYMLGSAGGMVAGGFLAVRGAHDRVIAAALGASACVAALLATGALAAWTVPLIMAVMGFGVGLAGPSRDLLVRRAAIQGIGPAAFGRVYGFVYSGMDGGFSVAPLLFGPVMDAGYYSLAFYGIALLQLLAVASALMVGVVSRRCELAAAG